MRKFGRWLYTTRYIGVGKLCEVLSLSATEGHRGKLVRACPKTLVAPAGPQPSGGLWLALNRFPDRLLVEEFARKSQDRCSDEPVQQDGQCEETGQGTDKDTDARKWGIRFKLVG